MAGKFNAAYRYSRHFTIDIFVGPRASLYDAREYLVTEAVRNRNGLFLGLCRRSMGLYTGKEESTADDRPRRLRRYLLKRRFDASTRFICRPNVRDHVLFVFSSDYLGLTTGPLKTEDCIDILSGANAPFVLREMKKGQFNLMGSAYVHGIMYGEFVEGGDQKVSWMDDGRSGFPTH